MTHLQMSNEEPKKCLKINLPMNRIDLDAILQFKEAKLLIIGTQIYVFILSY